MLRYLGEEGYLRLVEGTMRYMKRFQDRIDAIEGLTVLGKPDMSLFAYTSQTMDIYAIATGMEDRGWMVAKDAVPFKANPLHAVAGTRALRRRLPERPGGRCRARGIGQDNRPRPRGDLYVGTRWADGRGGLTASGGRIYSCARRTRPRPTRVDRNQRKESPVKAAVLYEGNRRLEIRELSQDRRRRGKCGVETSAAGLCASDHHVMAGTASASALPAVLGHEGAGTVVEVGPGVTGVKPGDRCIMSFVSSCGHCRPCRSGIPISATRT